MTKIYVTYEGYRISDSKKILDSVECTIPDVITAYQVSHEITKLCEKHTDCQLDQIMVYIKNKHNGPDEFYESE